MIKPVFYNTTKFSWPKEKVEKLLNLTAEKIVFKNNELVSLVLVEPEKIQDLNNKYRQKNQVTDVLSFFYGKTDQSQEAVGEIMICPERAQKQAKDLGHSLDKEILRLSLHGFLHLHGYDHEKEDQAEQMESLEKNILRYFYDQYKKID